MYLSRWLVMLSVILVGLGAAPIATASAATKASTRKSRQAMSRVKGPAKLPTIGNQAPRARQISAPRLSAASRLPQASSLSKKNTARTTSRHSAPNVAARPAAGVELPRQGAAINPAKLRSKLDATRLSEVARVKDRIAVGTIAADAAKGGAAGRGNRPGQVGTSSNSFSGIANRAQTIRTNTAEQARSANSSTLQALENAMPGFRDRARGGSSTHDLAGGGASHRNPVTSGSSLGNFAGVGSGQFSDGGGVISAHKNKQGDIVIVKENGDIVTRYKNGDRGVNKPNGDTEYTFAEKKVVGTPTPPIEPIDYSSGTKGSGGKHTGGKQGSQKEPTPDDTTDTSGSAPRYVSGVQLRGLASRLGSRGEPTGEEATSGGPVDKSKSREGRNAQVGEPIDDAQVSTTIMPDKVQVKQALQLRLRNVTPIPR